MEMTKRVKAIEPEVGMGATLAVGSDRYPYTIVRVTLNSMTKKASIIELREDKAILLKPGGPFIEDQEYRYEPDDEGRSLVARKRKDGNWYVERSRGRGAGLIYIGDRRKYRDPSF
jgi:hypothetical protein